jgi:hypothetical protein
VTRTIVLRLSTLSVVAFCLFVSVAAANCPTERTANCGSVGYGAGTHAFRATNIRISLNGTPACGYGKGLVQRWLQGRGSSIRDLNGGAAWLLLSRNPYEFTVGLCGDLTFDLSRLCSRHSN